MPSDIRSFFGGKGGQVGGSSQEQSAPKEAAVSIDDIARTPHCYPFGLGQSLDSYDRVLPYHVT